MNTRILFAVVVSMFVCQQVHTQAQDDPEAEVTELEGTWEVVSYLLAGEQRGVGDRSQTRFQGNRTSQRGGDDEDWKHNGTFSLDPSAMPPEIDVPISASPDETEFISILGIYELDGDSLTVCFAWPRGSGSDPVRPDRFESTKDLPTILIVLRRVEEDDE